MYLSFVTVILFDLVPIFTHLVSPFVGRCLKLGASWQALHHLSTPRILAVLHPLIEYDSLVWWRRRRDNTLTSHSIANIWQVDGHPLSLYAKVCKVQLFYPNPERRDGWDRMGRMCRWRGNIRTHIPLPPVALISTAIAWCAKTLRYAVFTSICLVWWAIIYYDVW